MKTRLNIISLFLFISIALAQQFFVDYSSMNQQNYLNTLFKGVYGQFFVDLGGYDPFIYSNTANLYARGWGGIVVEASTSRFPRFPYTRLKSTNLNLAIGNEDQMVTLMELTEDSSSTISQQFYQVMKNNKNIQTVKQVKINSITLRQLCQRYFYRRPTLLSIDIEGFEGLGLNKNDWSNPLCRPDVLIIEVFYQNTAKDGIRYGQVLPQEVMVKNGYKQLQGNYPHEKIFIEQSVYLKYEERVKLFNSSTKQILLRYSSFDNIIYNYLKKRYSGKHYEATSADLYVYHSVAGQALIMENLNKFSNDILQQNLKQSLKDRPIVVYHFDVTKSQILLRYDKIVSIQVIKMNGYENMIFWKYHMKKEKDQKQYDVYIFDHRMSTQIHEPKIVKSTLKTIKNQNEKYQQIKQIQNKTNLDKKQDIKQIQQNKTNSNKESNTTISSNSSTAQSSNEKQRQNKNNLNVNQKTNEKINDTNTVKDSNDKNDLNEKNSTNNKSNINNSNNSNNANDLNEKNRNSLLIQKIRDENKVLFVIMFLVILLLIVSMVINCILCLVKSDYKKKRKIIQEQQQQQQQQQSQSLQ